MIGALAYYALEGLVGAGVFWLGYWLGKRRSTSIYILTKDGILRIIYG